jgi:signal peptidase I
MILIDILVVCLISVVSVLIITRQFLMIATVEQNSMAPTICDGERLLIFHPWPAQWLRSRQIVLIDPPENGDTHSFLVSKPNVKRVIGLPGETVTVTLSDLDERKQEFNRPLYDADGKRVWYIPSEYFFVRGDSRYSMDSRDWGPIPLSNLIGIVLIKLPNYWKQGS